MPFPKPFYRWRPHPWHGLEIGPEPPKFVTAYVEITPFDSVKYEVDKSTGYLMVDRPYRTSSQPPALYGFIPRTYCGGAVCQLSPDAKQGDQDPLDICVLSERPIQKSDITLTAKVVGGIQMIDAGEADDKIISVLVNDNLWGEANDLSELPPVLIERLKHYFATYKMKQNAPTDTKVEVIYGAEHAHQVILASMKDYDDIYGQP